METKAQLRQIRISPRKVRLVANLVRGLSVVKAEQQLHYANKISALPILKLIQSAAASAEQQHKVSKDKLYLKSITVGDGITLKRWQPKAMGRATPIRKRASHVVVVLTDKPVTKKVKSVKRK